MQSLFIIEGKCEHVSGVKKQLCMDASDCVCKLRIHIYKNMRIISKGLVLVYI